MPTGWGGPLVAVFCVWAVVGLACLPLLGFSRVRTAFGRWPTDQVWANYLVLSASVVFGHAATFFAGVVVTGGFEGSELVRWTIAVAGGYPIALWILVGVVASASGRWSSLEESRARWLALGFAALWYAVVVVIAAATVFFVLFVLYFPG